MDVDAEVKRRSLVRTLRDKLLPGGAARAPGSTHGGSLHGSGLLGSTAAATPTQGGLSGAVAVTVIRAEQLPVSPLAPSCDPYCIVSLPTLPKTKRYYTGVRKRTASPRWDEMIYFEDINGSEEILFTIKHSNRLTSHRKLAKGAVDLHALIDGEEHTLWVDLKPQGRLLVKVVYEDTSCLFGLPLEDVCRREGREVPLIITRCIEEIERRGLRDVGLYRVGGNARVINELRSQFVLNPHAARIDEENVPNINAVVGVFKLYLRELPEPLFTSQLYPSFMEAAKADMTEEARIRFFEGTLAALPRPNLDTAVAILDHLVKVLAHESETKMSAASLATCFGPTVFTPAEGDSAMQAYDILSQNAVVRFLLEHWRAIRVDMLANKASPLLKRAEQHSLNHTHSAHVPSSHSPSPSSSSTSSSARLDLKEPSPHSKESAGPLLLGDSEDVSALSIAAFREFCCGSVSAVLQADEFRRLCESMGVERDITEATIAFKHRDFGVEDFAKTVERNFEQEAKSTARVRAQSICNLRYKREKQEKARDAKPHIQRALVMFGKYAKEGELAFSEFHCLCYDMGCFISNPAVFAKLDDDCRGRITKAAFLEWWSDAGSFLVPVYEDQQKARAFLQAVSFFQFYDTDREGVIDQKSFATYQGELVQFGYVHVPKDLKTCLEQLKVSGASSVAFNVFIQWMLRLDAFVTVNVEDAL